MRDGADGESSSGEVGPDGAGEGEGGIFEWAERALDEAARLHAQRRAGEAEGLAREALARLEGVLGPEDPNLASALVTIGQLRAEADDAAGSAAAFERAAGLLEGLREDPEALGIELGARRGLGLALTTLARYEEARAVLEATLDLCREHLGDGSGEEARTLNALGMLCKYTGRFDEGKAHYLRALALVEAAVEPDEPDGELVATLHHNLGGLAHARGDFAEAEPHARRAVALRTALCGAGSEEVALEEAALAPVLEGLGQVAEAEATYLRVLPVFRERGRLYDVAVNLHNLAALRHDEAVGSGSAGAVEATYREALALKVQLLGEEHPDTALTQHNLASLLGERDPAEALVLARAACAVFEAKLESGHPHAVAARELVARLLGGADSGIRGARA